jgi:hypothetical protein
MGLPAAGIVQASTVELSLGGSGSSTNEGNIRDNERHNLKYSQSDGLRRPTMQRNLAGWEMAVDWCGCQMLFAFNTLTKASATVFLYVLGPRYVSVVEFDADVSQFRQSQVN